MYARFLKGLALVLCLVLSGEIAIAHAASLRSAKAGGLSADSCDISRALKFLMLARRDLIEAVGLERLASPSCSKQAQDLEDMRRYEVSTRAELKRLVPDGTCRKISSSREALKKIKRLRNRIDKFAELGSRPGPKVCPLEFERSHKWRGMLRSALVRLRRIKN